MENELLRAKSEASVKAILDYAYEKDMQLENESKLDPTETDYYTSAILYWREIALYCEQELELRIKQIFPL